MRRDVLSSIPAIVLAGTVVSGCAAMSAAPAGPASPGAVNRDAARLCEPGRTFSCVERMGKTVRCICADKDALREVFDPLSTVR